MGRRRRAFLEHGLDLYAHGEHTIWTDPYLRRQLVLAQLDPATDAASRRPPARAATVDWLLGGIAGPGAALDLGCGPGLYAEALARRGWRVTGIDVNGDALARARASAAAAGLERDRLDYLEGSYLVPFSALSFDLAYCIYCDVGALRPVDRTALLVQLRERLRPGGQFVFDVFGTGLSSTRREGLVHAEEAAEGFWCRAGGRVRVETRHFPAAQAWGQEILLEEHGCAPRRFVLWDHYFTPEGIETLLAEAGFELLEIVTGIAGENTFTSDDVLFVRARRGAGR